MNENTLASLKVLIKQINSNKSEIKQIDEKFLVDFNYSTEQIKRIEFLKKSNKKMQNTINNFLLNL